MPLKGRVLDEGLLQINQFAPTPSHTEIVIISMSSSLTQPATLAIMSLSGVTVGAKD